MQKRTLGKTGIETSVVGIGTWQLGGEWAIDFDQATVDSIFDAGRECGINLVDTAECYGDHLAEKLVGEAIKRDRDQWIVATKFGHKFHTAFERTTHWSEQDVVDQLDSSLKALQTDYVDLLQFHSGSDEEFQTKGMWEVLAKEVEKGKVRWLGNSIGSNSNVRQTDRSGDVGVSVIQVIYNRLQREPEDQVLPSCHRQNLGVLARVPLASGFLSGKYKPGAEFPANDVREVWMKQGRDEMLKEVERIRAEEVPEGVDMASWALAWCLRSPAVTAVIPGIKSAAQVRSCAAASELTLPA
jgi:myo-inositol catabolism protein IolS